HADIRDKIIGFVFEKSISRFYPQSDLFSHVVGFTDLDMNGIEGIEFQYDKYLKNSHNPLFLTLDARIQAVLRNQLIKSIEKYKAKSAIGIVGEVKTGNILAMVSLPDFNPNNFNRREQDNLYNKATSGVYEMGSIFKIFTIALGLDKKIIEESDKFDISQVISFGKYKITQEYFTKRLLNPKEILEKSSNVGAGLIGLKIGMDRMQSFYKDIGFFDRIPSNFPVLANPLLPKHWTNINTLTISYGYGMAVTPLHVIMGVGGIVNNGQMFFPRFTKQEQYVSKNIIKQETSKKMNEYLRNVVKNGTGIRANTLGYNVGGKTGSVRLLTSKGYKENSIMANFIGIFPMNNPHILVYVMIEDPKTQEKNIDVAASNTAAPIASRIIEQIAPILNIVPYIKKNE
ncbi:MAG: penicillin-binding protein 2, partial [Rickettsiales bacterium]|nr:penicillin-binding protein 2 [Rickettsiales bacterium]